MSFRKWFYRNIFLRSAYWKAIRRRVARRADYTCEVVGCRAQAANLDAHHVSYDILFFEWIFIWRLIYLCRYHHEGTHHGVALRLKRGGTLKPFSYRSG